MHPTKDEIKAWLKRFGHSREWLGVQCGGFKKRTVDNWLSTSLPIPDHALRLISRLMQDDGREEINKQVRDFKGYLEMIDLAKVFMPLRLVDESISSSELDSLRRMLKTTIERIALSPTGITHDLANRLATGKDQEECVSKTNMVDLLVKLSEYLNSIEIKFTDLFKHDKPPSELNEPGVLRDLRSKLNQLLEQPKIDEQQDAKLSSLVVQVSAFEFQSWEKIALEQGKTLTEWAIDTLRWEYVRNSK